MRLHGRDVERDTVEFAQGQFLGANLSPEYRGNLGIGVSELLGVRDHIVGTVIRLSSVTAQGAAVEGAATSGLPSVNAGRAMIPVNGQMLVVNLPTCSGLGGASELALVKVGGTKADSEKSANNIKKATEKAIARCKGSCRELATEECNDSNKVCDIESETEPKCVATTADPMPKELVREFYKWAQSNLKKQRAGKSSRIQAEIDKAIADYDAKYDRLTGDPDWNWASAVVQVECTNLCSGKCI